LSTTVIPNGLGDRHFQFPRFLGHSHRDGKDGGVSPAIESGKKAGGYWIRGKKRINLVAHVYSSYKHYTKQGHASVVNGNGDYKSGGWKPKDTFSTAKLVWTTWGTNKAYYNYK
jgi:hypothetical protein